MHLPLKEYELPVQYPLGVQGRGCCGSFSKGIEQAELKAHSNESFKQCIFISEIDKYTFMFSLKGKDSELFLLNGVIEIHLMELMPSDQHCLPAVWQWM